MVVVAVVAALLGSVAAGDDARILYPVAEGGNTIRTYALDPTPAAVGLEAGLVATYSIVVAGYFILRGSVAADRQTGVDRLIATTPVSKVDLLVGKWLAQVVTITGWLVVVGVVATVTHTGFDASVVTVVGGVLLLGLPAGAFVAGVTVLFESVDRLAGTTGSVVYFLGILGYVAFTLDTYTGGSPVPFVVGARDLFGNVTVYQLTIETVRTVDSGYAAGSPGLYTTFLGVPDETVSQLRYTGGSLQTRLLFQRGLLTGVGLALTLAATVPYDRWDPHDGATGLWARVTGMIGNSDDPSVTGSASSAPARSTPVEQRDADRFVRLVTLELRRLLRGRRWWWYVGVVVLLALTPIATTLPRQRYVGAALVWPVFVWSSMGVGSSHGPLRAVLHSSDRSFRQLTAEWVAGALVAVFVTVVPIVAAGVSVGALVAATTVTVFVPSAALAAGLWTGSSRAFELGYLVLWYLGPMNVEALDYGGATLTATQIGSPLTFLAVTPILIGAVYLGRRRLHGV